ncbi:membrane-spanning 4-domains subfamily A member 4A [Cheilinus undulatus]|uniref:membrane-spanning 4-domains subfamily A member 4A n=1 Tax=Cheilinus undulatus TaxID=241271 RepID=UPI001BD691E4|nr:membrane-spanning 4-domains subfamily A member 4A [Cheilinus undulatus]
MTSTSITKVGGVMVVTQVIPQDEKAIPLQDPAASPARPPPSATLAPPSPPPTKMDDMTATFLRGEPQGLGIVQIIIGVLCVLFSLTAIFSSILLGHAPFCFGVTFVVSGSLALAASRRTSVPMIRACLTWNLIGLVFGVAGIVYTSFQLADRPPSVRLCESCTRGMWLLDMVVYGLLGLLMVLLVLHVCVTITVCVFSVRALRHSNSDPPIIVTVDGGKTPLLAAASLADSDVALLDSEGEEPCCRLQTHPEE